MAPSIYDFLHRDNIKDLEVQSIDIDCNNAIVILDLYHKRSKILACKIKVAFFCKDKGGWFTKFDVEEYGLLTITPQARSALRDIIENTFGNMIESLMGKTLNEFN